MSFNVENSARNNYGLYAVGAGRAERSGQWSKAEELWLKALGHARTAACRQWANARAAYCSNAVARGWSGCDEG